MRFNNIIILKFEDQNPLVISNNLQDSLNSILNTIERYDNEK